MKKIYHLLFVTILLISLLASHVNVLGMLYTQEDFVRYAFKKSMAHEPIEFLINVLDNQSSTGDLSVKGYYDHQKITFQVYQSSTQILSGTYEIEKNQLVVLEETFELFQQPIPIDLYIEQVKEALMSESLDVLLLKRHKIVNQQPIDEYLINEQIRVGINYKGYIIGLWYDLVLGDRTIFLEFEINYL